MNARTGPLITPPAGASIGRVNVNRAACGRGCVRAISALKNPPLCGTRHQINKHLNDSERQQKRMSQLSQLMRAVMRQKKPMKSTVSQLSQLSQSKNHDPEANTTTKTPAKPARLLPIGAVIGGGGTPPFQGTSTTFHYAGAQTREKRAFTRIELG